MAPNLAVKIGRALVLASIAVLTSCGRGASPATVDGSTAQPASTSEAPTEADFHADWCDAVLGFARVIDDLPTLQLDARTVRGFDDAVQKLDDLSTALEDAGLSDAAASVRTLANAIADEADALHNLTVQATIGSMTDALNEQTQKTKQVNRALAPALDALGGC